jgi:hypothetical protein
VGLGELWSLGNVTIISLWADFGLLFGVRGVANLWN